MLKGIISLIGNALPGRNVCIICVDTSVQLLSNNNAFSLAVQIPRRNWARIGFGG